MNSFANPKFYAFEICALHVVALKSSRGTEPSAVKLFR